MVGSNALVSTTLSTSVLLYTYTLPPRHASAETPDLGRMNTDKLSNKWQVEHDTARRFQKPSDRRPVPFFTENPFGSERELSHEDISTHSKHGRAGGGGGRGWGGGGVNNQAQTYLEFSTDKKQPVRRSEDNVPFLPLPATQGKEREESEGQSGGKRKRNPRINYKRQLNGPVRQSTEITDPVPRWRQRGRGSGKSGTMVMTTAASTWQRLWVGEGLEAASL